MKKLTHIVLLLSCLFVAIPTFADEECDQSLKEAKALYNAGKYTEAKELFVYVQKICSPTYGSANTWVQKCDQAIADSKRKQQSSATTLSANNTQVTATSGGASEFISITSNKSWTITNTPASWCQVSKSGTGLTVTISANADPNSRSTSIQIATTDNKKNLTIYVDQAANSQTTTSTLSLDKTSISTYSSGTTEYISVSCNTAWEVQYASGTMYSVTRSGNTLIVKINPNTTTNSRSDYFNVKTTDGSQIVKVNLSQSGTTTGTYRVNSGSVYPALDEYNSYHGKWEVEWFSGRLNLCTGVEFEASAFAFRYSLLKIEPLIFGWRYDFINDYSAGYYQPEVKLVFPWSDEWAAEFGIGPSVNFSSRYGTSAWFVTEVGVLWHWGEICSSDFFMRYDGMFVFGVSINFSTGF